MGSGDFLAGAAPKSQTLKSSEENSTNRWAKEAWCLHQGLLPKHVLQGQGKPPWGPQMSCPALESEDWQGHRMLSEPKEEPWTHVSGILALVY